MSLNLAAPTSFGAAFLVGLVAASSSCIAVSGGLLLSAAAKWRERFASNDASAAVRMRPVAMFVAGRVASYGFFGGAIGLIGKAFLPSPTILGAVTILAAAVMLVTGLDLLGLAPHWLKALIPRMPKAVAVRVLGADGNEHPLMPALLGGATFFLPCGFTQSLQLYALTTGSAATSAMLLLAFALGSAPALLALGWASGSLKGKAGSLFLRFSGAAVIVLGLWNIQNGLTLMGHPLQAPDLSTPVAQAADPNVRVIGGVQVIQMRLNANPAYLPSDRYTVRAGLPVRMEIEGPGTGCRGMLVIPRLRQSVALTQRLNVLEFTPTEPGRYGFSCSMGMYPGIIDAIAS